MGVKKLMWFSCISVIDQLDDLLHKSPGPSSSMMVYSPIAKKSPIDEMGKNIWGKLMVFLTIRSIYPNGKNYNKLLLNYGENLCEKLMGKIFTIRIN